MKNTSNDQLSIENISAKKGRVLHGVIAGGLIGTIELLVAYPADYVKTQLQLDRTGVHKKYDGIIDCVQKTIKGNGIKGLYRGMSITLLGNVPKTAVRFSSFETLSGFLKDDDGRLRGLNKFVIGFGTGALEAILAVTPKETIKVKFINAQRCGSQKYKGLVQGVKHIIRTEGLTGIYRGLTATILKQGTNQGIRICIAGMLKDWYTNNDPTKKTPKLLVGLFGGIAGATSVLGNNPIDVVKTRMQGLGAAKYKSTLHCVIYLIREEGFAAFYKGTVPRLIRICFSVGLKMVLYESLMDSLAKN